VNGVMVVILWILWLGLGWVGLGLCLGCGIRWLLGFGYD